jgi:hypothetical protein
MAIDDGRSRETKAWLIQPEIYAAINEGDLVKVSTGRVFNYPFWVEKVGVAPTGYGSVEQATTG